MWEELFGQLGRLQVVDLSFKAPGMGEMFRREGAAGEYPLKVMERSGVRLQSIADDLLVIVDRAEGARRSYSMLSPRSTLGVLLPIPNDDMTALHQHDYLELVCVLEGELEIAVEGGRLRYRAGDCTLINQSVLHQELSQQGFCVLYLSMRPGYLSAGAPRMGGERPSPLVRFLERNAEPSGAVDYLDFSPIDRVRSLKALEGPATALVRELVERGPGYLDIVHGLTLRILSALEDPRLYVSQGTLYFREGPQDLFERTCALTHARLRRLSRAELADALGYSANYINDVFVQRTGITLAAYIRTVCMQQAARLLLNTDRTCAQISEELGYESRSSFYRQFERAFGMTPAAYREAGAGPQAREAARAGARDRGPRMPRPDM